MECGSSFPNVNTLILIATRFIYVLGPEEIPKIMINYTDTANVLVCHGQRPYFYALWSRHVVILLDNFMKNANLFTFFLVRNAHNLRTCYFLRVVLEEMIQSIEVNHSSKASVSPQLFRLVTTMLFTECKV